jgi:hypothetical protein
MKRFGAGLAAACLLALPGCESFRLFQDYRAVESPEVADARWPRLVEVPEAPPPGAYGEGVPDPAEGVAVETELSAATASAGTRRGAAAREVLSAEERARLGLRDAARAERARRPLLTEEDRSRLERD